MSYPLSEIKDFSTIDLDIFEIRGAKTGINNARTTGPLYVGGQFDPLPTILTGTVTLNSDSTASGISFGGYDASTLVAGDVIVAGAETFSVLQQISATSVKIDPASGVSGTSDATFRLTDRDYLIEPDVLYNTTTGLAAFNNGDTTVVGYGTQWLTDLIPGDSIQLNTYKKYFIVKYVTNDSHITLTKPFDAASATGFYTSKRWRLGRLDYRYVRNDFIYDKNSGRWKYDATTDGGIASDSSWATFIDGVELKFSPTMKPLTYPDVMDSNVVNNKTFAKSTEYPMFQFPLPAVPKPEESLELKFNGVAKDRFPDGNMDYVISYSQDPVYRYPPPMDDRKVANVMFLKRVNNVSLPSGDTALGVMPFRDASGNLVPGIMPGSETIKIGSAVQTLYEDYVIDIDAGIGRASQVNTDESVVRYISYPTNNLYDYGLSILLKGVPQKFTIPRSDSDEVIFDVESGRLKPVKSDHPAPGDEYQITYLVEGDYVTNENIKTFTGMEWFRVSQYPIKYLSVIVIKNGIFLDEGTDFRVSYLTGRVILFIPLISTDVINVNYSPLNRHVNGLSYADNAWYCTSYYETVTSFSVYPPVFQITNNKRLGDTSLTILSITNITKGQPYDITGYSVSENRIVLKDNPTNAAIETVATDLVFADYKFKNKGVEFTPVETINFLVGEGSDYVAFINQNITGLMPPGTFIRLTNVDSAGDHFFRITDTEFNGEDTVITLEGTAPSDIINPTIYLSDSSSMGFIASPVAASPIPTGTTEVVLPGQNLIKTIRPKSIINLGADYYYVQNAQYDASGFTILSTSVPVYRDYTSASVLGSMQYSDGLMYYEGDTVISPAMDVIDDPSAVVMSLNYPGLVTVSSDVSSFYVDTGTTLHTFKYSSYSDTADLASGLQGLGLSVVSYATDWTNSKIIPFENTTVTQDSSTPIHSYPELQLFDTDYTNYSLFGGEIVITDPLLRGQRYTLNYLGQRVLGDSTVNFSGSYFTTLPAKSKISASMKFDNIDQFYIQALSQRNFLENVTEPRMAEEAAQQSGNVGQGGDLPDDEDQGKAAGGLTNDEFRRMDTAIECRVFDTIFDFFNGRMQAFSNELYAAFGWKVLNSGGLLSEDDQSGGALPLNRMFPWSDYTSFPPYMIAGLTGQTTPYAVMGPSKPKKGATSRAQFITGSATVNCTSTRYPTKWTKQLAVGDFIRAAGSTKDYEIASIPTDTQLILTTPFAEHFRRNKSQAFTMTAKFPMFDDNGHMGAKLIGTESEDFELDDGDVFDLYVDGTYRSALFNSRPIFDPDDYSTQDIAKVLNKDLIGVHTTFEWVPDPTMPYGFRESFVLRTTGNYNSLVLGDGTVGTAIEKLGFEVDSSNFGNLSALATHNALADPEYPYTVEEKRILTLEVVDLATLIAAGLVNKLDRVSGPNITLVQNVNSDCSAEVFQIDGEMPRVAQQISATGAIIQEPTLPSYPLSLIAYNTDMTFLMDCFPFRNYSYSIFYDYETQDDPYKWVLDLKFDVDGTRTVNWKDTAGVGVEDFSAGAVIIMGQTTFKVGVDPNIPYDRRFLNATVNSIPYAPYVTFQDTSLPADGYWTGWEPSVSNQYSTDSTITFNLNPTVQFTIQYTPTIFNFTNTASDAIMYWDSLSRNRTYPHSSYPTIGVLKAAINSLAGLSASGDPGHDGSSTALIDIVSIPLSPNADVTIDTTVVFTITDDGVYSHTYSVDTGGVQLSWDNGSKYYSYGSYPNVGAMKTGINSEIPGLNAMGGFSDSSVSGFLLTSTTAIPPDADIYAGLRPCSADYYTIDDQLLKVRDSSANARLVLDTARLVFLSDRTDQIKQHVIDEEYFRSTSGATGNLYDWANNRFNRSTGCEARLKQIEKLIEMNQAALNVSRMFL